VAYLSTLDEADLDRVVDRNWDPPVTAGVRLVSVVADDLQHAGQAAYIRGSCSAADHERPPLVASGCTDVQVHA